jgi:5'-nucleotidase
MKRLKVGIDLDTTLNNLDEVWIQWYNKEYNDNLTVEDMIDWDVTKYVKPECGKDMYKFLWTPGLFRSLGIRPYAQGVCNMLSRYFDLYIVTASHPNVVPDKWAWVEKHLPFIPYERFIPLKEKNLLDMDYLIDDGPHNIEAFTKGTPVIIDMPYNRYLGDQYVRCHNWKDVMEFFIGEIRRLQIPPLEINQ